MLQAIATNSDSRLNEFVQHMQKAQGCLEQLLAPDADTFHISPRKVKCAVCQTMDRLKISQDSEARKLFACSCKRDGSRPQKLFFGLGLLIILILSASLCRAQDIDAPKRKFLDKTNITLLATSATAFAADGYTTERLAYHMNGKTLVREINPLANPFMTSPKGCAVYFGGSLAVETSLMYFAHRKGWHMWERIIPMVVTSGEGFVAWHNSRKHD
jgi:hypothetical protein